MKLAILYDKCTKCDICEKACPQNAIIRLDSYPIVCLHCSPESAPCLLSCPVGAIKQQDGILHIDPYGCIGCGACFLTCPIAAIRIDERGKAVKCHLCSGEEEPLCSKACPAGAIKYGDELDDCIREKRGHLLDIVTKVRNQFSAVSSQLLENRKL